MADKDKDKTADLPLPPAPPTGQATAEKPAPIGVPEDYLVEPQEWSGMGNPNVVQGNDDIGPRYFVGDVERTFGNMAPETMFELQDRLKQLGILDASNASIGWGYLDEETKGGLATLLAVSNQKGTTWDRTLAGMEQQQKALGIYGVAAKKPRPPLTVRLTNRTDLHLIASRVAKERLGRELSEAETARFVAAYQAAESSAQHAEYDTTYMSEEGGTVTDPPSAEGAALSYVDAMPERDQYAMTQTLNDFFGMLGGPV